MKNFIIIIICVLSCLSSSLNSQTNLTNTTGEIRTFSYELLVEAPIFECDILGNQLDTAVFVAPKGAIFSAINTKGNNVIIRFWVWHKDEYLMNKLNYKDSLRKAHKYFLLSQTEFKAKAIIKHSTKPVFTIASSVIPLRIRPNPFDFSSELSFGSTFGAKFRLSPYQDIALHLVFGLHITHTSLDSLTTRGAITSSTGVNQSALTPAIGFVFEFSKAQIGIYLGRDFITGDYKEDWIYQGKTWFSIGLGASLFSNQSTATSKGKQHQS